MLIQQFLKSQFYKNKSPNLIKLGFNYDNDLNSEFFKIQSMLYSEYHIKCESMLTIMKKFNIPSSRTMDIIFKLQVKLHVTEMHKSTYFNLSQTELF